ncbi:HTH-type transcriptional repressor FabR [Panacagrimonas sp.]|uniref:HTH-type transcriptional repressor FabR n=1 Tax=Panacagrimonas sp. TaxID=2480088 RepID=UPI003B51F61C
MTRPPKALPVARTERADAARAGRPSVISRESLIAAALKLVGPHRSVSSLSLREIARKAGIAPNSFYRHFRDTDELAIALIDLAGRSLRQIIGEARHRAVAGRSVIRSSVETFVEQLDAEEKYLHVLLREGSVGSDAFKRAVERELQFFEHELQLDLVRLAELSSTPIARPELVAKAITRLVFAMGANTMDLSPERRGPVLDQTIVMLRMIVTGAQTMAKSKSDTTGPER